MWQIVEQENQDYKPLLSGRRLAADVMHSRECGENLLQRLSMPKLLPQRLAVAVQVLRHVEMVFQTKGLQSLRQSVREGRNNVRGM